MEIVLPSGSGVGGQRAPLLKYRSSDSQTPLWAVFEAVAPNFRTRDSSRAFPGLPCPPAPSPSPASSPASQASVCLKRRADSPVYSSAASSSVFIALTRLTPSHFNPHLDTHMHAHTHPHTHTNTYKAKQIFNFRR